jgi:hypothetical protein
MSACCAGVYTLWWQDPELDVRESVHRSTTHTAKNFNKMQQCIKIYYSIFMEIYAVQRPATTPSTTLQDIMQNQRLLVQF